MAGPRRPIAVAAGEACARAGTAVADSAVGDPVAADSVAAADVRLRRDRPVTENEIRPRRKAYVVHDSEPRKSGWAMLRGFGTLRADDHTHLMQQIAEIRE